MSPMETHSRPFSAGDVPDVPGPMTAGLTRRRAVISWVLVYSALSCVLVAAAWPHLDTFPPISADEVWIFSASFKLADEAVLGSDLFAGLHGADRHYFLNLPIHHAVQSAVFIVTGSGITQARAPSLAAAVVVLWAVGWLSLKWLGVFGSLATGILLVFWRSNVIAPDVRPAHARARAVGTL